MSEEEMLQSDNRGNHLRLENKNLSEEVELELDCLR